MPVPLKQQEESQQSWRLIQKARNCYMQMEAAFSSETLRFDILFIKLICFYNSGLMTAGRETLTSLQQFHKIPESNYLLSTNETWLTIVGCQ